MFQFQDEDSLMQIESISTAEPLNPVSNMPAPYNTDHLYDRDLPVYAKRAEILRYGFSDLLPDERPTMN